MGRRDTKGPSPQDTPPHLAAETHNKEIITFIHRGKLSLEGGDQERCSGGNDVLSPHRTESAGRLHSRRR